MVELFGDGRHKPNVFIVPLSAYRPTQWLNPSSQMPVAAPRCRNTDASSHRLLSSIAMPSRYAQWMYEWEHRLTSVDNNRVVRPLEWGVEWARDWPCRNGFALGHVPGDAEKFLIDYNRRIVASSPEFYSYATPADYRLERREVQVFSTREVPDPKLEQKVRGTQADFLRFTSPVRTPYPENNLMNARWFPARGRRAVVLLPHWNADAIAYTGLCRVLESS